MLTTPRTLCLRALRTHKEFSILSIVPDANASIPSPAPADGSANVTDRSITHADTATSLITKPASRTDFSDHAAGRLMKRGERHKRCGLGRCCECQSKCKSKSRDHRFTHVSLRLTAIFPSTSLLVGEPPSSTTTNGTECQIADRWRGPYNFVSITTRSFSR